MLKFNMNRDDLSRSHGGKVLWSEASSGELCIEGEENRTRMYENWTPVSLHRYIVTSVHVMHGLSRREGPKERGGRGAPGTSAPKKLWDGWEEWE
jgi:hypothetical protein